jgi:hypothetical protein
MPSISDAEHPLNNWGVGGGLLKVFVLNSILNNIFLIKKIKNRLRLCTQSTFLFMFKQFLLQELREATPPLQLGRGA